MKLNEGKRAKLANSLQSQSDNSKWKNEKKTENKIYKQTRIHTIADKTHAIYTFAHSIVCVYISNIVDGIHAHVYVYILLYMYVYISNHFYILYRRIYID